MLRRRALDKPKKPKKPKLKKCVICPTPFEPRGLQQVCSPPCAIALVNRNKARADKAKAKADRAETRRRKKAAMTRSDWIAELQRVFNAFIRARDADKPCICCGIPFEPNKLGGSMDAGHYLSRGSAPHLRFDERNVHGQRKNCNRPGGTTRKKFRQGMIDRIGLEAVEALEADQDERKWTIPDLEAMVEHYKLKTKELKR